MKQEQNKGADPRKKGDRSNKQKKAIGNKVLGIYLAVLLLILGVIGTAMFIVYQSENIGKQVAGIFEGIEEVQPEQESGSAEAEQSEKTHSVKGTGERKVTILSCEVLPDGTQFALKGEADAFPESDDNNLYLLAMKTYEDAVPEDAVPIACAEKKTSFMLKADILDNTADSRLYSKFVVAVKKDGKYEVLSTPQYITNPEALASYSEPYPKAESIKGLLVDPQKLGTSELDDLGVKQAAYNIPIARLLGPSTHSDYPTIIYNYNGKDYTLNGHVVSEYDYVFKTLSDKGIVITAILLNNKSDAYPQVIHPLSRGGNAYYYAFNAAEEAGTDYLAERYRDEEHGIVMNWIIGNEVNVRSTWNYMKYVDIDTYAREYARAVRLFYNGIKSFNANARIYISLDQQWNRNLSSDSSYDSRDLMDAFNECIKEEGNIQWGLAHHPYSYPMTWPKFWELTGEAGEMVQESEDTSMVTIYNIDVVTNYLQKEEYLMPDGEVRSVILSEMGFTSTYGEDVQAAAFAYAYYIAENNQHIDSMLLSRETDDAGEVAQGLALGLSYQNGRRKYIYDTFKYIDTDEKDAYTEFAKNYSGIKDWEEVIIQQ